MASPCPTPQVLRQLLLGELLDPEATQWEQHFSQCDHCVTLAASLKVDDTLVTALHGEAAAGEELEPAEVEALIDRIKPLRPILGSEITEGAAAPVAATESGADGPVQPGYAFLSPAQAPDEMGRLGGYRVLKVLGEGGMGVVFLAEDPVLKRQVALKAMRPGVADSPAAQQRFLREAQAIAALEHDHIIPIHQVGQDHGVTFLAMPLLKGKSLEEWLRHNPRPQAAQVLRIGRQIARGLAAAHAHGLIHRDIKPGNLWLEPTDGGRIKILDFGLARAVASPGGNAGEAHLTQSGVILGTPAYMAPEQAEGKPVDARADLFSLGGVLYRMCTGRLPFAGNTPMAVLAALVTADPKPVRELNPEVPPALAELVMRLLAKDPERRPAAATDVAKTLQQIERSLPERAAIEPRALASGAAAVAPPYGRGSRGRRRWPLAVAAGVLLVLGAVLAAPIIIRITGKDGKVREIRVPEDSQVEVIRPAPPPVATEAPLQLLSLVKRPAVIPGVQSWTIETTSPRGGIQVVAFSPDGRLVATAGGDRAVRLWNATDGRLVRVMLGEARSREPNYIHYYNFLAWSPDGKQLAAVNIGNCCTVWDVNTGRKLRVLLTKRPLKAVAWSPNGSKLAAGEIDAGVVHIWEPASGERINGSSVLRCEHRGFRGISNGPG